MIKPKSCSNSWKGIANVWDDLMKHTQWKVGDKNMICAWVDHWVPIYGALHDKKLVSLIDSQLDRKVSDLSNNT